MLYDTYERGEIRKLAAEMEAASASRDLTPEDMAAVAGGWDSMGAGAGAWIGGMIGGIAGTVVGIISGPIGWCILGGTAGGALYGYYTGGKD